MTEDMELTKGRNCLVPIFVYEILELNTNWLKHFGLEELERRLDAFPYEISVKRQALARILNTMVKESIGIHYTPGEGAYYESNRSGLRYRDVA